MAANGQKVLAERAEVAESGLLPTEGPDGMNQPTYEVRVERDFDAPIERMWQAWTDPADLRAWWGPEGFSCPRADVDVRPGGRIFVTMRAPAEWGAFEQHSTWSIIELEAPRMLRYVFRFADADGNAITAAEAGIPAEGVPDEGEHEVVLTSLEGGRTRLEMTEKGYTTKDARDLSRGGLDQCLDKMAVQVASAGS